MAILNCYVDNETLAILVRECIKRGRNETATELAEHAIADAASHCLPPQLRGRREAAIESSEIERLLKLAAAR